MTVPRPTGSPIPVRALIGPIEKNVAPPEARRSIPERVRARLQEMEIGDSFVTSLYPQHARYYAKKAGFRVTIQRMSGGCRVWRVG